MRVFFSFLLVLNVTVFAKRFVESLHDREGVVQVVNGREVEVIGEDVTEELTGNWEATDSDKGTMVQP